MWCYNSPIGVIKILLRFDNRYVIEINEEIYGSYPSPQSAADDVYNHATGCYEWDSLDGSIFDVPSEIDEWAKCL